MTKCRLFIDTINLTIYVPEVAQQQAENRLLEISAFPGNLTQCDARRSRYRLCFSLAASNGEEVRIAVGPRQPSNAFMRLDYSPDKIDDGGAELLSQTLSACLGPSWREYFRAGTVRRIDVTFNVPRVSLRDLWIIDHRSRAFKSALIRGAHKDIETIYCGYSTKGAQCTSQLIVYDKQAERRAANSPSALKTQLVRFEYRRSKCSYTLEHLYHSMRNPYDEFSIKRYTPIPDHLDNVQSRLLFDACRMQGKVNVLARLPANERMRWGAAIDAFPTATFFRRPLTIWHQLRERINELTP